MKLSYFNLRFSSWQHKKTSEGRDYTFMQDPNSGGGGDSWQMSQGGGKEELGEEE